MIQGAEHPPEEPFKVLKKVESPENRQRMNPRSDSAYCSFLFSSF